MSGINADPTMTIDLLGFEANNNSGDGPNYRIIQWPQKVTVTGVCFTVNRAAAGDEEDARVWRLYAVKGRKARTDDPEIEVGFGYEDVVPFFGFDDDEKPTVTCVDSPFISTIGTPVDSAAWFTAYQPYAGNIAQMDPDEYLVIWVEAPYSETANYDDLVPEETQALVSISYTGSPSTA